MINLGLLKGIVFLIISLLNFGLAIFILAKNPKHKINISLSLAALFSGIHPLSHSLIYLLFPKYSFFLYKMAWLGIFIVPSFLTFVLFFSQINPKKTILIATITYSIGLILFILSLNTSLLVKEVLILPSQIVAKIGPLDIAMRSYIFILICLTFYYLFKDYQKSNFKRRECIKYLFTGIFIYGLGGLIFSVFLPLILKHTAFVYLTFFFSLIWLSLTTYSILYYHLLDIKVAFKKITLITLTGIVSLILIYSIAIFTKETFSEILGSMWFLFPILISLIIGFLFNHLTSLIINLKEEEFSREKYRYRAYLWQEIEKISQAKNTGELFSRITHSLKYALNPSFIKIFLNHEELNKYLLQYGDFNNLRENPNFHHSKIEFSHNHCLILYLKEQKELIDLNKINFLLNLGKESLDQRNSFLSIKDELTRIKAELCLPIFKEDNLLGLILMGNRLTLPYLYSSEDLRLISLMTNYLGETLHKLTLEDKNLRLILSSIQTIVNSVEAKDSYTGGHSLRVFNISLSLGKRLLRHLPSTSDNLIGLKRAAILHDVGKLSIPEAILTKYEKLSKEEFEVLAKHPEKGIELIKPLEDWLSEDTRLGILQHHENFDGSGYPKRIKEKDIHIYARIIRVADAFDALTTDRPYSKAMEKKVAIEELKKLAHLHFDSEVIDKLVELNEEGLI